MVLSHQFQGVPKYVPGSSSISILLEMQLLRTYLTIQRLILVPPIQRAEVRSLVRELRSHMPCTLHTPPHPKSEFSDHTPELLWG